MQCCPQRDHSTAQHSKRPPVNRNLDPQPIQLFICLSCVCLQVSQQQTCALYARAGVHASKVMQAGRERKRGMRKGTGRGKEAGKGACKGKGEHWGDQLLRASCMLQCYHYI